MTAARAPRRIQMTRNRPWRAEHPGALIVDRRGPWGNPFAVRRIPGGLWQVVDINDRSRALREEPQRMPTKHDATVFAVRLYELHTGPLGIYQIHDEDLDPLRGRDLACWCPLPAPGEPDWCHAAVLLTRASAVISWCIGCAETLATPGSQFCGECAADECADCLEVICVCDEEPVPERPIQDVPTRGLL